MCVALSNCLARADSCCVVCLQPPAQACIQPTTQAAAVPLAHPPPDSDALPHKNAPKVIQQHLCILCATASAQMCLQAQWLLMVNRDQRR